MNNTIAPIGNASPTPQRFDVFFENGDHQAGFIDYSIKTIRNVKNIEVHISNRKITTKTLYEAVCALNELTKSGHFFILCAHIPDSSLSVQRFAQRYGFRRWYKKTATDTVWGLYQVD